MNIPKLYKIDIKKLPLQLAGYLFIATLMACTPQPDSKNNTKFIYSGYPKNANISIIDNGILTRIKDGELSYAKVPNGVSTITVNGYTKIINILGQKAELEYISKEEALKKGVKEPVVSKDGKSISIGGVTARDGNSPITTIGGNDLSIDTNNSEASNQLLKIDLSLGFDGTKIDAQDVEITGTGNLNLSEIDSGDMTVGSGATVNISGNIDTKDLKILNGAVVRVSGNVDAQNVKIEEGGRLIVKGNIDAKSIDGNYEKK